METKYEIYFFLSRSKNICEKIIIQILNVRKVYFFLNFNNFLEYFQITNDNINFNNLLTFMENTRIFYILFSITNNYIYVCM